MLEGSQRSVSACAANAAWIICRRTRNRRAGGAEHPAAIRRSLSEKRPVLGPRGKPGPRRPKTPPPSRAFLLKRQPIHRRSASCRAENEGLVYTAREARHDVCSRLMASSAALAKFAHSGSVQCWRLPIFTSIALSSALATAYERARV